MKESIGDDHLAVAWECAGQWGREIIPAIYSHVTNSPNDQCATLGTLPVNKCFSNKADLQNAVNTYLSQDCTKKTSTGACTTLSNARGWPIGNWCTSLITDMSFLFKDKSTFNENISGWNMASVTNMQGMFQGASSFNTNVGAWNVGLV